MIISSKFETVGNPRLHPSGPIDGYVRCDEKKIAISASSNHFLYVSFSLLYSDRYNEIDARINADAFSCCLIYEAGMVSYGTIKKFSENLFSMILRKCIFI